MSRQLFTVCVLVVSAFALVSAQNFNPEGCSNGARAAIQEYTQRMQKAVQTFVNSAQQTGSQAVDISDMQSDIDQISESMASLTNMSGGFDAGRFSQLYLDNLSRISSLMRKAFRPSILMNGMDSYMSLGTEMVTSYTVVIRSITQSCMPSARMQPMA